ncbi:MAG: hypothetical protein JXK93_14165 [Sphaerochaetaceae bacterium]|nr:hypothetical protein [Sphaerochaetaceae bacterium]
MAQEKTKQSTPKNSRKRRRKSSKQRKERGGNTTILDPLDSNRKKKRPLTQYDPIEVLKVEEPAPLCALCSQPIKAIAQALSGPGEGEYSHFDCVIRKITEDERPTEKQKVSYIGKGTFAIVDTNDEGHMVFVKRIVWESAEKFEEMKKFVEGSKR